MYRSPENRRGWSWWYLLLLVQFVAVLWPPFYNRAEPYWVGMPFFYWYQLLWIIIGAFFTAIVYLMTEEKPAEDASARSSGSTICSGSRVQLC